MSDRTNTGDSAGAPSSGQPTSGPAARDHTESHGGTVANWTANAIIVLAFLVGTIGVVFGQTVLIWVGVALLPIGLIVGKVLSGMGYGAHSHNS